MNGEGIIIGEARIMHDLCRAYERAVERIEKGEISSYEGKSLQELKEDIDRIKDFKFLP